MGRLGSIIVVVVVMYSDDIRTSDSTEMQLVVVTALLAVAGAVLPRVIVTGATGRTGALVYANLKADPRIGEVRALVRNASKAAVVLKCSKCDESEGIYVGDVTVPASLEAAFMGMTTVAIAVGGAGTKSEKEMRTLELDGLENQIAALAKNSTSTDGLRAVLCSSGETTNPRPLPFEGGKDLFWKLNGEAFLGSSGIASTIVKPCGLGDGPPGKTRLVTGHDDKLPPPGILLFVKRADVAAVMSEAVAAQTKSLRFNLCSGLLGKPTPPADVLKQAAFPWARL